MKKLTTLFVVLSISIALFLPQISRADPGDIYVPGDYPTIQEGIDAAFAGDTVHVAAGTYYEHITMKNGVTVQGAGAEVTTIDGGNYHYTVLANMSSNAKIDGFTITNGFQEGIHDYNSSLTITNNIITGNRYYGITSDSSSPTITNNTITGNSYSGINNFGSTSMITNNTITGNGSGIRDHGSSSLITNNIITGSSYSGIYTDEFSSPTIDYNDVWDNGLDYDGTSGGPNDISQDPLFVNPGTGDYHLQAGSLCIDAGSNIAPALPTTDFEGDPRIVDGDGDSVAVVDMGADEYYVPNLPPVADPNGPYVGALESLISFDGTGSSDPDDDSLIYDWDWGDTTTSLDAGATPTHAYSTAGIYDVCLSVTDPYGASDIACTYAVVYDPDGGFVTGGGWIDSPAGAYYPSDLPYFDGSYYEIVILEHPLTFAEAREAAEAMTYRTCESAHLATITSQGEYDAVLGLFNAWHHAELGGYQDANELVADEGWEWVTGEPFDFEVQRDWWLPGEPNDCGDESCTPGSEQILQMYPNGWNDVQHYDALSMISPMVEYENCELGPTGKATFGFVSKYKKGASVPTGNTEFQFKTADLNFHSDSYEWLVVTGGDYARFKGVGTINGEGEYKFQIWAGDGDPDTFRIKIWTEDEATSVETVVYDNGFDQALGGGSIIVHTKK